MQVLYPCVRLPKSTPLTTSVGGMLNCFYGRLTYMTWRVEETAYRTAALCMHMSRYLYFEA